MRIITKVITNRQLINRRAIIYRLRVKLLFTYLFSCANLALIFCFFTFKIISLNVVYPLYFQVFLDKSIAITICFYTLACFGAIQSKGMFIKGVIPISSKLFFPISPKFVFVSYPVIVFPR